MRWSLISEFPSSGFKAGLITVMILLPAASLQAGEGYNLLKIEIAISVVSRYLDLPEPFVRAVVKVESNFDPLAVSPAKALGLMQLLPETAQQMGVLNPFDPIENLLAGCMLLRFYLDKYGSAFDALTAFHAGEGAVGHPPRSTIIYISRVLTWMQTYSKGGVVR